MPSPINILGAFGLALGAVFGITGTFVTQPHIRGLLWAVDGAGLVMATTLLARKYFRTAHDVVAAGLLVFATAEAVMLSRNRRWSHGKRAVVCGGHSVMGDRAPPHQHPEAIRASCAAAGRRQCDPPCSHLSGNFLGRATAANVGILAFFMPIPSSS